METVKEQEIIIEQLRLEIAQKRNTGDMESELRITIKELKQVIIEK